MSYEDLDPHSRVQAAVDAHKPVEAQYARQGRRGFRIIWVLAISLALAALVTFGLWFSRSGDLQGANRNNGAEAVDAQSFSTQPSAPAS